MGDKVIVSGSIIIKLSIMIIRHIYIHAVIGLFFLIGCGSKKHSLGMDDEIRIVCSKIDEPIIKKYLQTIFNDTIFTPKPEPVYKLFFYRPSSYQDLKKYAHLIIASVKRKNSNSGFRLIEDLLPEYQSNNSESENPLYLKRDLYAKDQVFMVINAINKDHLYTEFEKNKKFIHYHYNQQFNNRTNKFLFKDTQYEEEKKIKSDYNWDIKVPWGWEILKNDRDSKVFWMGAEYPYRWLSVNWENGNMMNDELVVGQKFWKSSKSHFGTISFSDYAFTLEKIYFNKSPGWRCTGVWASNDSLQAKGGPFQSFIFYDKTSNRTFHINTLVYSPGKAKAAYLRQLEYIAKSINTSFKLN